MKRGFEKFGPFGHHGNGPMDFEFGGFRAGRGMMEPAILAALKDKPMHGYEIISTLEKKSHGFWRPSAGSVYPTLQLLEEKELVTSELKDGKKVFTLTDAGMTAAEEATHLHEKVWEERAEAFGDMQNARHHLGEIMHHLRTIYKKGTTEQKEQLAEKIAAFKSELEHIISEAK